jgi:hypothetical protein
MYGLTEAEMQGMLADVDRPADGLSVLEMRLIVNAARSGVPAALRIIDEATAQQGFSRSRRRAVAADLRALGPAAETPQPAEYLTALRSLHQFLTGVQS